jgi:hypothetical protein
MQVSRRKQSIKEESYRVAYGHLRGHSEYADKSTVAYAGRRTIGVLR